MTTICAITCLLMHRQSRWVAFARLRHLNPVPEIDRVRMGKTSITEDGEAPSIALALEAAPSFGLKAEQAKNGFWPRAFGAASQWKSVGKGLKIKGATLEAYASAFEQPLMDEAVGKSLANKEWSKCYPEGPPRSTFL